MREDVINSEFSGIISMKAKQLIKKEFKNVFTTDFRRINFTALPPSKGQRNTHDPPSKRNTIRTFVSGITTRQMR